MIFIVARNLISGNDVPSYTSLFVAILFFASVQLIGLGWVITLSDSVWSLNDDSVSGIDTITQAVVLYSISLGAGLTRPVVKRLSWASFRRSAAASAVVFCSNCAASTCKHLQEFASFAKNLLIKSKKICDFCW